MRHIKQYTYITENTEISYFKITKEEYNKLLYPGKTVEFTKHELDSLTKMNNSKYKFEFEESFSQFINQFGKPKSKDMYSSMKFRIHNGRNDVDYEITKVKDEWFIVEAIDDTEYEIRYYKCDQFDGLEKFLKDII